MAHALQLSLVMGGLPPRRARAALVLGLVMAGSCTAPPAPPAEDRVRLLSDPDGDGVLTEEGCVPDGATACLSLPSPDPACVYLEIRETTFTTVDADGDVLLEEATLCLTCLDAALTALYTDCGGSLPAAPAPSDPPPIVPGEPWCATLLGGDETTVCWDCVDPAGGAAASGCASIGQPVPPGTFCTAGEADGVPCVWCCDVTGVVLLEQCDEDRPLE